MFVYMDIFWYFHEKVLGSTLMVVGWFSDSPARFNPGTDRDIRVLSFEEASILAFDVDVYRVWTEKFCVKRF